VITDKHFRDWEAHVFGYGYGTGENFIIPLLIRFFTILHQDGHYEHEFLESEFGGSAAWLLINTLCHADILEYGTSPRYGWLTEKGKLLRDYFKDKMPDEVCAVLEYGEENVPCYPEHCNCGGNCNNPLFK
jgi:hypothetical protein